MQTIFIILITCIFSCTLTFIAISFIIDFESIRRILKVLNIVCDKTGLTLDELLDRLQDKNIQDDLLDSVKFWIKPANYSKIF